jgi:hypothetical protein
MLVRIMMQFSHAAGGGEGVKLPLLLRFVIGLTENREGHPADDPPPQALLYELECVLKYMIIKCLLVEAAGVELITMLTTRKLLIPGTARRAKKAPIARSIVRLLYENAFARESHGHNTVTTVSHRFVGIEKKAPFLQYCGRTFLLLPGCPLSDQNLRLAD